jgi:hypothetical protein
MGEARHVFSHRQGGGRRLVELAGLGVTERGCAREDAEGVFPGGLVRYLIEFFRSVALSAVTL